MPPDVLIRETAPFLASLSEAFKIYLSLFITSHNLYVWMRCEAPSSTEVSCTKRYNERGAHTATKQIAKQIDYVSNSLWISNTSSALICALSLISEKSLF